MTIAYNLSQLANYVNSSGQLDASTGLTNTASLSFPSGTLMLFQQTSAPTGWTKQTTHNNKALRVVSGTASAGGAYPFTTVFASGLSTGDTTLSVAQMPSHAHTSNYLTNPTAGNGIVNSNGSAGTSTFMNNEGGGGSHNHTMPSLSVQYVDLIIAQKN